MKLSILSLALAVSVWGASSAAALERIEPVATLPASPAAKRRQRGLHVLGHPEFIESDGVSFTEFCRSNLGTCREEARIFGTKSILQIILDVVDSSGGLFTDVDNLIRGFETGQGVNLESVFGILVFAGRASGVLDGLVGTEEQPGVLVNVLDFVEGTVRTVDDGLSVVLSVLNVAVDGLLDVNGQSTAVQADGTSPSNQIIVADTFDIVGDLLGLFEEQIFGVIDDILAGLIGDNELAMTITGFVRIVISLATDSIFGDAAPNEEPPNRELQTKSRKPRKLKGSKSKGTKRVLKKEKGMSMMLEEDESENTMNEDSSESKSSMEDAVEDEIEEEEADVEEEETEEVEEEEEEEESSPLDEDEEPRDPVGPDIFENNPFIGVISGVQEIVQSVLNGQEYTIEHNGHFHTVTALEENIELMSTEIRGFFDRFRTNLAADDPKLLDMIDGKQEPGLLLSVLNPLLDAELAVSISASLLTALDSIANPDESEPRNLFTFTSKLLRVVGGFVGQGDTQFSVAGLLESTASLIIYEGASLFLRDKFPTVYPDEVEPMVMMGVEEIETELQDVLTDITEVVDGGETMESSAVEEIVSEVQCRLELLACETRNVFFA